MKNTKTGVWGLIVCILTVLSLTGCEQPTTPTATLTSITAAYTGTAAIYPTTPLDNLKTGLTVTANYSDKTSKTLAPADYSLSGTLTIGTSTVTVAYEGKTTTFSVNVSAAALSGTISISPSTGVAINTELTATYSGSEAGITYQWKKDGANVGTNSNKYTPTAAGSYTVTVSATGYQSKTSATVDVSDPSLSTLTGTITISPNTGVTTGTELTATYSGSETGITYQWEKDGTSVGTNSNKYTPTEAGSYTVIVRATGYNSKTSATVTVTVSAATPGKTLTGITLNTTLVKTAYNQNEPLDLSDLVVTASYSDSTSAAVTGYTSSPANGATLSTTGPITVTISYTEGAVARTNTFMVTVNAASGGSLNGTWYLYTEMVSQGTETAVSTVLTTYTFDNVNIEGIVSYDSGSTVRSGNKGTYNANNGTLVITYNQVLGEDLNYSFSSEGLTFESTWYTKAEAVAVIQNAEIDSQLKDETLSRIESMFVSLASSISATYTISGDQLTMTTTTAGVSSSSVLSKHTTGGAITVHANHNWGAWVVILPATETELGVEIRTCTLDPAHQQMRFIPATGDE